MHGNNDGSNSKTVMDEIYEFENSEELLSFRFRDTGIPMWMFVRSVLLRAIGYVAMVPVYGVEQGKKRKVPVSDEKTWIDKYICRNPFFTLKKDIVWAFFNYSASEVHQDNKVYYDLVMPFMQMLPKRGTTIMSGQGTDVQESVCDHPNWKRDNIFWDILNMTKSREVCKEDRDNINGLLRYVSESFPMNVDKQIKKQMYDYLYSVGLNLKTLISLCECYLKIVRPKLVVIDLGSYSALIHSAMIIACRKRGITTAEFQHAWVGKNHENYYHGDLIVKDEHCKKVRPDYLLTMGSFWNSQVKIPQKIFTIGYAKLSEKNTVPHNDNILFAATCCYDQYEDILNNILPYIDSSAKIYFRLHPTAATPHLIKRFAKYRKYDCFEMAGEKDLDYYIKKCRYVIADGSTVCYEALYMGRIVFNLDNAKSMLYGTNELDCVKKFGTAGEFLELWKNRDSYESVRHTEFYGPDWERNFKKFLGMHGIKAEMKTRKHMKGRQMKLCKGEARNEG